MKKIALLFICILLLAGCSSNKDYSAITPERILKLDKHTSEDDFIKLFDINTKDCDIENTVNGKILNFKKDVSINEKPAKMTIEFADDEFVSLRYAVDFSGTTSHLEDAYHFMYAYGEMLQKEYGDPIGDGAGKNFMNMHTTFESFEAAQYKDKDGLLFWEMGDNYQIEDDYIYSVRITAWDEKSTVTIRVEAYREFTETTAVSSDHTQAIDDMDINLKSNIKVEESSECVTFTPLSIPAVVDGQSMTVLHMADKNRLLCALSSLDENNIDRYIHELGVWDIAASQYGKLLDVDPGLWYVVASDQSNIILEYLCFDGYLTTSTTAQLWLYDMADGEMIKLFDYSCNKDGYNGAVYANHRLIHDGWLYFEDLLENDFNQWLGKAYRYHWQDGQLEFLGDNLQNPMLMNGSVWYIQIGKDKTHHFLKNIDTGETMALPEGIYDIAGTGQDIFVLYEVGEHPDNGLTIQGLKRVNESEALFTATRIFEKLQGNENLVVWNCFQDEYPMFYDNKNDQLVRLTGMDKCEYYYWMTGNFGLMLTRMYHDDETKEYQYYLWEYRSDKKDAAAN